MQVADEVSESKCTAVDHLVRDFWCYVFDSRNAILWFNLIGSIMFWLWQVLAQMGLSGQTLFANSDGTISVDGSLLTIQGQPVQLAGHVPSTVFGYGCLFANFSCCSVCLEPVGRLNSKDLTVPEMFGLA